MLRELAKKDSKALRSSSLSIKEKYLLSYLQRPLFSILLCYIAGIILQNNLRYFDFRWIFLFCSIILISSLLIFKMQRYVNRYVITIFLLLFFLLIGMLNTSYHLYPQGDNHIYNFFEKEGVILGTVYQAEIAGENNYQEIQLNSHSFQYYDEHFKTNGLVLLRLYSDNPILQYGDVIKARVTLKKPGLPGNFGEFNYREYLARKKIFLTANIINNQVSIVGHDEKVTIFSFIQSIKSKITQKIEQIYQFPARELIKAIVIGNRRGIPQEWIRFFQDAGIMHILAISGLHVGILAMVLFFTFNLIPHNLMKNNIKYLTIVLILIGYAAMTGFRPSVSRATLMFAIVLGGRYFNRPYHLYNSLSLAALFILLWQPLYLFEAGFLLSFVVTFFIIYLTPILEDKFSFLPSIISKPLSISCSAWLGIIPLSAYFFYKISIIAILANMLIIPLIGIILVLALVTILLSFLYLPLASLSAMLNQAIISVLAFLSQLLSSFPFAYQYVAQPELYTIILYYLIIFISFHNLHFWLHYNLWEKKKKFWIISTLIFLFVFMQAFSFPKFLEVHFINVGQGDCIFIKTPQRKNILIDGGGTPYNDYDVGSNTLIPYLRREGISQIDIMFLTHPDLDHLEGLIPVLDEMKVKLIIDSGITCNDETYRNFISLVRGNEDIDYYKAKKGDVISLNDDIDFFVLNSSGNLNYDYLTDFNNQSIVLKLRYKKTNFLFTGDIEKATEINLLSWNDYLKSDILKVAHHGSNSSTSRLFVEKVQPEIAVISVGPNFYGHPHQEVIRRLEDRCQMLFRTDINGTILIECNGNQYSIKTLR
ncbi:MAG: DNA internalization-related competence protein ComEC/Rec2 [Atribacterota bacterium]